MNKICILGIHVTNRVQDANRIQEILTKFGCSIKTRLGLHEVTEEYCAATGLILLELTGNPEEFTKLENELTGIPGLDVQKMVFEEE
jgi:hypothetical protein